MAFYSHRTIKSKSGVQMSTQETIDKAVSNKGFSKSFVRWVDHRLPIFTFLDHELHAYPTPRNLTYLWNFGSLAGITLVIMIVTGIVLAMHFTPSADGAFGSVEHIMRDVNYGWLMRYLHTTGASLLFAAVYIHIFRGMYYGSYKAPRELLWALGVVILLLMMATAFFGYTLPWGQMSFWGATVITNLFSAIPIVGDSIVTWLSGGFTVGDPTLHRFYALHYLLPFVIVAVILLHLVALHRFGSNNPTGIDTKDAGDTIPFHPYYTVKDLFGLMVFLIVYAWFVFYEPGALLNPDNSIPANPGLTPVHIVPEWYLLPYYAILRAIPNKLIGVSAMVGSIMILFLVPWLDTSPVRSARFRSMFKQFFWMLVADCVLLTYAGGQPPEGVWLILSRIGAAYYFLHFLMILPVVGLIERPRQLPGSISQPVLQAPDAKRSLS
jgi:ubiquinol-cytochrome c reductase cytochrome b subunit